MYSIFTRYKAGSFLGTIFDADTDSMSSARLTNPNFSSRTTYFHIKWCFSRWFQGGLTRTRYVFGSMKSFKRVTLAGGVPLYLIRTTLICWRRSSSSWAHPLAYIPFEWLSDILDHNASLHSAFVTSPMSHHSPCFSLFLSSFFSLSTLNTPSMTQEIRPSRPATIVPTSFSAFTFLQSRSAPVANSFHLFRPKASIIGRPRSRSLGCCSVTSHFSLHITDDDQFRLCSSIFTEIMFFQTSFAPPPFWFDAISNTRSQYRSCTCSSTPAAQHSCPPSSQRLYHCHRRGFQRRLSLDNGPEVGGEKYRWLFRSILLLGRFYMVWVSFSFSLSFVPWPTVLS